MAHGEFVLPAAAAFALAYWSALIISSIVRAFIEPASPVASAGVWAASAMASVRSSGTFGSLVCGVAA